MIIVILILGLLFLVWPLLALLDMRAKDRTLRTFCGQEPPEQRERLWQIRRRLRERIRGRMRRRAAQLPGHW